MLSFPLCWMSILYNSPVVVSQCTSIKVFAFASGAGFGIAKI